MTKLLSFHNDECLDKTIYWECDRCDRALFECTCKKPELYKREPIKKQTEKERIIRHGQY